jgi:acetyl esterase/lipase
MKLYRVLTTTLALLCAAMRLAAQTPNEQNTPSHWQRKPDFENIRYGPHERNELDLYLAKTDKPTPLVIFFNGGAWLVGNKYLVPLPLIDECQKAGITVAAANYRYSTQAPYPVPFLDCARALQFLRWHAKEYNINPKAVAATGSSAGAVMSLWLGFRPDMADPKSDDPVARQSTRISSAGVVNAQPTIDRRELRKLIGEKGANNPGLPKLFGLRPDEMDSERAYKLFEDASPAHYLSKNAPPVFMFYNSDNTPVTDDMEAGVLIHHPVFGVYLKKLMDAQGVECVLHLRGDYKNGSLIVLVHEEMVQFFLRHFPK